MTNTNTPRWAIKPQVDAFATDRGWECLNRNRPIILVSHKNLKTKLIELGLYTDSNDCQTIMFEKTLADSEIHDSNDKQPITQPITQQSTKRPLKIKKK